MVFPFSPNIVSKSFTHFHCIANQINYVANQCILYNIVAQIFFTVHSAFFIVMASNNVAINLGPPVRNLEDNLTYMLPQDLRFLATEYEELV